MGVLWARTGAIGCIGLNGWLEIMRSSVSMAWPSWNVGIVSCIPADVCNELPPVTVEDPPLLFILTCIP